MVPAFALLPRLMIEPIDTTTPEDIARAAAHDAPAFTVGPALETFARHELMNSTLAGTTNLHVDVGLPGWEWHSGPPRDRLVLLVGQPKSADNGPWVLKHDGTKTRPPRLLDVSAS